MQQNITFIIKIRNYYNKTRILQTAFSFSLGAAGFWVSLDRILTKYGFRQPRRSTFMFFVFSILILLGHSMLHHVMMRHPLVQYYLRLTNESRHKRRIQLHLNPTEDATLVSVPIFTSSCMLKRSENPTSQPTPVM